MVGAIRARCSRQGVGGFWERVNNYNDLKVLYKAYANRGVDFPPKAHETMIALGNALQQSAMRVPTGELERTRRLLERDEKGELKPVNGI